MAWLDDHPPDRTQFRCPRRDDPSGVIVVHTAESVMDTVGPDTGAENVARFIQHRDTPGSYHDLVDSDSDVGLVRYDCEAFHDATGSNPHSLGLSFACSYLDWAKMPADRRDRFIERGAQRAALMARWVHTRTGVVVPARRVTRDQSAARVPGFISHAERDPDRRKDPGNAAGQFPWTQFLDRYRALMGYVPPPTPGDDDDMAPYALWQIEGNNRVYHVAADGVSARHVDNATALGFDQDLLKLGGYSAAIHVAKKGSRDEAWLRDLLKDAGVPVP